MVPPVFYQLPVQTTICRYLNLDEILSFIAYLDLPKLSCSLTIYDSTRSEFLTFPEITVDGIRGAKLIQESGLSDAIARSLCFNWPDILLALLHYFPDQIFKLPRFSTLINDAALYGYFEVVKFLLDWGVDPNNRVESGWTPLMMAAGGNHIDIMKLLIESGADINAQNLMGGTALIWAITNNALEAIHFLLQNPNLDLSLATTRGNSILYFAREKPEIKRILLEAINQN